MTESLLKSGRDALLLGIPLVAFLIIVCFRLDELIFRSKTNPSTRKPPPASGFDQDGLPIFCDPDGRPVPRK
jgi:hypothetical protein